MSQPYQFKIELHRIATDSRDTEPPLDLTPFVKNINIALSTQGPWEQASLMLHAPRPRQFFEVLTEVFRGGWLVISDLRYGIGAGSDGPPRHEDAHRGRAIFWGWVASKRGSMKIDERGALHTGAMPVQAIGWLDFLGRVRVQKAPGVVNSVGTLIGASEWSELFEALAGTVQGAEDIDGNGNEFRRRDIGESIKPLLEVVAKVLLPPSLGGREIITRKVAASLTSIDLTKERVGTDGTVDRSRLGSLGDKIAVVHDAKTRDQFAPNVTMDPVPGWTIRGIQSFALSQSTAQQLILGTFSGDPNMVELYPALEDPAVFKPKDKRGPQGGPSAPSLRSGSVEGDFTFGALRRREVGRETAGPKPEGETRALASPQFANQTAQALGVNPVLVYRIKPWRTEELGDHVEANDVLARQMRRGDIDETVFRGVTWRGNPGAIRSYEARDVFELDFGSDDANHVNCVTVGLPTQPDSDIKWLERAGLPVVRNHRSGYVWRNGLRVYEPQWPFFPPFDDDAKRFSTDLIRGLRTVAVQAAQFMGHADRFLTGTVLMRFDSTLRPGQFIDITIPAKGDGLRLSAYVEKVAHRIWVEERGQVKARTSVAYSRGLVQEGMNRGQQFFLVDKDKETQGGSSS